MFCTNCGKKVPDESKFCPVCGTPLYREEKQIPVKEQTPIVEPSPRPEPKPKIELTKEDQTAAIRVQKEGGAKAEITSAAPSGNIDEVIGKNTTYYLAEFKKVDEGQKTKFNLAAFFLGLFFCFYRKCGDLFKKYFLIPVMIVIAALIVIMIGFTSFSLALMAVGGVLSAIGSIWALVSYIRFGKNFNRDYYEHCKTVLASGNKKKYGTSIGSALIVVVAVVILSTVPYIISLISLSGTSNNLDGYESINSTLDGDDGTLDGEYVIVEDTTSNEYIFLNFNWDGPGTLQISSSENPAESIEVTYNISPTSDIVDDVDSYTLTVSNDYLGENAEFFSFCEISDDIYYIVFSESFADEDGETATMVPRTEEYGFTSNPTERKKLDLALRGKNDDAIPNDESSIPSNPNQSTLRAEQERLYSALNEQIKELHWYENDFTGCFLDEYDDIYIEVIALCDDHGSEIYFLNYWASGVQLEAIPSAYAEGDHSIMFFLDDYFSDYKGFVEIAEDGMGGYSLCSEVDNCQDTGGYYNLLEKIS